MYPSYLNLVKNGEIKKRIKRAKSLYERCILCPNVCKVNRTIHEVGKCGVGDVVKIASANLHFGEEPPISGKNGSGTIFFSGCTLECVFCQNYPISQYLVGKEVSVEELSEKMILLQERGAHNINIVTGTHFIPSILEALEIAVGKGLKIPIVWNTSGYENKIALNLLNGIVDVYLPDIKYSFDHLALKYSSAKSYVKINRRALIEMYRQVGDVEFFEDGTIKRGMIVRHLILPNFIENSKKCLKFLAENFGDKIYISLMSQYFPAYKAPQIEEISRGITEDEYEEVVEYALELNLTNGWYQPFH